MQNKDCQKLRECPFCGGEAILESNKLRYGTIYSAYCQKCGAEITRFSEHETITAWNCRAEPESKPLSLDELRQMDGEPVWVEESNLWYGGNGVVSLAKGGVINPDDPNGCWPFENYGEWLACRSKPKEEV